MSVPLLPVIAHVQVIPSWSAVAIAEIVLPDNEVVTATTGGGKTGVISVEEAESDPFALTPVAVTTYVVPGEGALNVGVLVVPPERIAPSPLIVHDHDVITWSAVAVAEIVFPVAVVTSELDTATTGGGNATLTGICLVKVSV